VDEVFVGSLAELGEACVQNAPRFRREHSRKSCTAARWRSALNCRSRRKIAPNAAEADVPGSGQAGYDVSDERVRSRQGPTT
jgi:hypothetical protein